MPLPICDRATALNKSSPISFFALYDWIILNLFTVVFQPLGRLGYLLDWIEGGLEIETLYLVFGPIYMGKDFHQLISLSGIPRIAAVSGVTIL